MSLPTDSKHLRIAVIAPISWRTPPRHYGPWELFASLLTEGLVRLGHDVTLFATADSVTTARLHSTSPTGWSEDLTIEPKVAECLHIASVFEQACDFDVIHNSFDFLPLITTIHGFSSEAIVAVFERYNDSNHYVSISDTDRHQRLRYESTVHHGIDVNRYPFQLIPDGYLLFFGRIHPDKGTSEAIQVAKRSHRRLVIAGIVQDHRYFEDEIKPHLDGVRVTFVGAVGSPQKEELLANASALLHLITFDEPFGFSVVEAMACGTPTIAFSRGSMPEIVEPGAGFLVANVESAVEAVRFLPNVDRHNVRSSAQRFLASTMVSRYEKVYSTVLGRQKGTPNGSHRTPTLR
jgi:glycosyltransferase involved in cell wall biosynthesis